MPGYLVSLARVSRAIAFVMLRLRAATAAAPVHHPFAILVFPRENFGFEGVDGVFGS